MWYASDFLNYLWTDCVITTKSIQGDIKKSAVYMFVYELLCELFFINYL